MIATFFRHGSNAVLALVILAAIAAFALGAVPFALSGALIGAAVFFVSEYTTHRFLFHAQPSKAPWLLKLQHRLHYDHHIDPPKLELLFLPLWFVLPTTLLYFGLYAAITRNLPFAFSLAFGSVCALFYYEWVHYVAHIPFTPKTTFGRFVKKYHLWHHFKNEHFWYGVTNPSMDFAGASYRDVEAVERSTTVREIWRGM
ncbi:MAG TPA: sterol desaturase family protein [Candidatus Baltobacteraceae bacterium]|nr:sterol desaturase family protein [Candidatus Baltobacteraceae bacterium]